jgi:hypothetical protein
VYCTPPPPVPAKPSRKPPQRRPHARSVKVIIPALPGIQPLTLIRITQDDKAAHYWVSGLTTDFGLGFRLEKAGEEVKDGEEDAYSVLLEEDGSSCTCPGHTFLGYCKHVDALRALLGQGRLPLPPVPHGPAPGAE